MHHDHHFAVERQGVKDIFLNSPNQGAWLERFVTDWTGPTGGSVGCASRCASRSSPATRWCSRAPCATLSVDDAGCGWVELDLTIRVGDVTCTESEAKVAMPTSPDDNPWQRHGDAGDP